jgi:pimeloyl-ACP methyl ester carboxylesterase
MPLRLLHNAELFYEERGQGQPLLFLNGLSGDHLYWRGQLRALGKDYRCLAIDNRDVGQSSYATEPYSIGDLAADVLQLMDELALPPAHVVGLSMGGMIAQELALAAPEHVRSVILVDTLARADDWFRCTLRAFELIRRQVADTGAFFEAILPWWVSHRFFDESDRASWLRALLRQNPYPQRLDGFLRQLDACGRHDACNRLSGIACPVLVLVGEDDCIAPMRYSRQLQKLIPQAQLVVLPGVGHAPPIEDGPQFNTHLATFLRGLKTREKCA